MAIYDIPTMNVSSGGFDEMMTGVVREVPAFTPMLLVFVFLVILLGGSIAQKRRTGSADIPMWTVTASVSILILSLVMTLAEGMINFETLSIVVGITVFSGLWFFFDKNRNEV